MKSLIIIFAACAATALAQNPVPLMNAATNSTTTIASGGSFNLTPTWTCPSGTCTATIDQNVNGGSAVTSGSNYSVSPTATTTYTLNVSNNTYGVFEAFITVFVTNNTISVTQYTTARNGGNGCPSTGIVLYGVCEISLNYAGAGCASYNKSTTAATACTGGTITNPWEDVQIRVTFTGPSAQTYLVDGYYVGGVAATSGNDWAVRFLATATGTWTYSGTFGQGGANPGAATFSGSFTVAANPNASGYLQLNGSNPNIFQTSAAGAAFYPLAFFIAQLGDTGNFTTTGIPLSADAGSGVTPPPGANFSQPNTVTYAAFSGVGFNFIRATNTPNAHSMLATLGVNNNIYYSGNNSSVTGVGGANSVASITFDGFYRELKALGLHVQAVPIGDPQNLVSSLNVFTSIATTEEFLRAWRYAIARYSVYVDVWEVGNEQSVVQTFNGTMAAFISSMDPYQHLSTISYPSPNFCASTTSLAGLSFCDTHYYDAYNQNPTRTLVTDIATHAATQLADTPNTVIKWGEAGEETANLSDPQYGESLRMWVLGGYMNKMFPEFTISQACNLAQGGSNGESVCIPQLDQMAIISPILTSMDPNATTLVNPTIAGSTGCGCTLSSYELYSTVEGIGYIVNSTASNTNSVTGGTVNIYFPAANMFGEFINLPTGTVLSTFSGPSAAGNQATNLPAFCNTSVNSAKQNCDVLYRIRQNNASLPVVMTLAAPGCLISTSCSLSLVGHGGSGSGYTWKVTAGALPVGMTLSGSTISGTPTVAGNWNFSVTVTDGSSQVSAAQPLIMVISPAFAYTNVATTNLTVGQAENGSFAVAGGVPPVWLTSTPTGVPGVTYNNFFNWGIGAATSGPGSPYTITLNVEDSLGNTATLSTLQYVFTSTVGIFQSAAPNCTVNYFCKFGQFNSVHGTGPYTYSVTSGSLPTGMSIVDVSTVTYIMGTPTVTGTYTFTLQSADSASHTATFSYTMVVSAAPSIGTTSLPSYSAGGLYYQGLSISSGTPPYFCAVVSGAMPAGWVLDSQLDEIYGVGPPSGTYNFTVQCWDNPGAPMTQAYTLMQAASTGGSFIPLP